VESDDVGVGRQSLQRLNLSQVVNLSRVVSIYRRYLVDVVEVGLHALDGHILPGLDGLRFKNFREGALALLAYQSIL